MSFAAYKYYVLATVLIILGTASLGVGIILCIKYKNKQSTNSSGNSAAAKPLPPAKQTAQNAAVKPVPPIGGTTPATQHNTVPQPPAGPVQNNVTPQPPTGPVQNTVPQPLPAGPVQNTIPQPLPAGPVQKNASPPNTHIPPDKQSYTEAEVAKYIPDNIENLDEIKQMTWARDLPNAYIDDLCARAFRINQSRNCPTGFPPCAPTGNLLKILKAESVAVEEKIRRNPRPPQQVNNDMRIYNLESKIESYREMLNRLPEISENEKHRRVEEYKKNIYRGEHTKKPVEMGSSWHDSQFDSRTRNNLTEREREERAIRARVDAALWKHHQHKNGGGATKNESPRPNPQFDSRAGGDHPTKEEIEALLAEADVLIKKHNRDHNYRPLR